MGISPQGGTVDVTRELECRQAPVQPKAVDLRGGLRGNPVWTLVVVGLGIAMVGLDATVVVIANPYIAHSLRCSLSDLQWVANAYLLALAVLLIPMGKVGDRFGRRLLFLVGVTGFALTSLAVGKVGSIGGVIAFRALLRGFRRHVDAEHTRPRPGRFSQRSTQPRRWDLGWGGGGIGGCRPCRGRASGAERLMGGGCFASISPSVS